MIRGIYASVSSMITLENKQAVTSNNLANINTVGFKSEKLIQKSFDEVMLQNKDAYVGNKNNTQKLGHISLGVGIDAIETDYEQGLLVSTDKKSDFALMGDGFFTVRDQQGKEFYSREGSFKIDNEGYLITPEGYYVLGVSNSTGVKEPIYVGNNDISLMPDNTVIANNIEYKFATVDFANYDSLKKVGNNVYTANNPVKANITVKQGFLEKSNTDVIEETANMMAITREYQANQTVVQTIDSTLRKAASEIGSIR